MQLCMCATLSMHAVHVYPTPTTTQVAKQYCGAQRDQLPPHVFAVADKAYQVLLREQADQVSELGLCSGHIQGRQADEHVCTYVHTYIKWRHLALGTPIWLEGGHILYILANRTVTAAGVI